MDSNPPGMTRALSRVRMSRPSGFTLVELMIVVAILGVLAVVAGSSYRKYSNRGRATEVMALFGEFKAKEEAYRAETGRYCGSNATNLAGCLTQTNEAAFWPALAPTGEPLAKSVDPVTARPQGWQLLGINPGRSQLYCGYVAIAGAGTTVPPGAAGQGFLGTAAPGVPWFYLRATCDNDGAAGTNATFLTAMNTTQVFALNENR